MKKILSVVVFFLLLILSVKNASAAIDQQTVNVANAVVKSIFDEILNAKLRYKELANFEKDNLKKNKYGINTIEYKEEFYLDSEKPFELGVAVVPIEVNDSFDTRYQTFHFTFPFLGIKIIAYQVDNGKAKQFDLAKLINKEGRELLNLQQDYMPFRMKIIPDKPVFAVGDKIGFTVKLINHSNINLEALKISEETLYLNIEGSDWGSEEESKGKGKGKTLLKPGDSIEKHFDVDGYERPRQVQIYGSYNLTFEGIKPSAVLSVPVIKAKDM